MEEEQASLPRRSTRRNTRRPASAESEQLRGRGQAENVPPPPPPRPRQSQRHADAASSVAPEAVVAAHAPPPPAAPAPAVVVAPPPQAPQAQQDEPPPATKPWTLLVRSQKRRKTPPSQQHYGGPKWQSSGFVVRILVTPTMTPATLGRCIVQATCASSVLLSDDMPAAGIFRERDCLFVPLESILAHPNEYEPDVWSLDPDSCRIWGDDWQSYAQTRLRDLVKNWLIIAAAIVVAIVAFSLVDDIYAWYHVSVSFLLSLPMDLTRALIDVPLREMYRYGPSMVGWEGASLAKICARITYHGDESFWIRNNEECERIYNAKEEATLRIARPVVYFILCYMMYQATKSIIVLYVERKKRRPDSDMEETYRAFNILIAQVGRAINKNSYKTGYNG